MGKVDVVMSVDQVGKEAAKIAAEGPSIKALDKLSKNDAFLTIDELCAGYGKMQILHDFSLKVGKGQSLCLIGPNGAGKSTVLHSIFGFTNIFSGKISVGGKDVTALTPSQKLANAGIAYILQDKSVFPGMTVEENLLMGGFLKNKPLKQKPLLKWCLINTHALLNVVISLLVSCQVGNAVCWRFPALW